MLFWLLVDVFWAGRGSHAISVFLTPVVCTDFVTSRGNASARAVGVVDTVTLVSLLLVLMQLQTDLYQSLVCRHTWKWHLSTFYYWVVLFLQTNIIAPTTSPAEMAELVLTTRTRISLVHVRLDILVRDARMWSAIIASVKMAGNVRYNDLILFFLDKTSFLNEPFDIIGNFLMCVILPRSVIQVLWPYFRELRKIMLRAFVPMVSMVNIVNTRNIIVKTQIAPMLARVLKKQTVHVVCV